MIKKQFDDRLTLLVSRELKLKARVKALREGTTISRLIRAFLAQYISTPPRENSA